MTSFIRPFPYLALTVLLVPAGVQGQGASSFGAVPPPQAVAQPAAANPDITTLPSRSIDPGDIDAYVAALAVNFSMRTRELDAFGHSQDPDAKPVIREPEKAVRRTIQRQETPFADIVQLLNVTTIMPGEQSFLVGTRAFRAGEQVPLVYRGKSLRVRVKEVSSRQIIFENLDSGETAQRQLNLLPPGMTTGTGTITAPGMVPDVADAPIDLTAP